MPSIYGTLSSNNEFINGYVSNSNSFNGMLSNKSVEICGTTTDNNQLIGLITLNEIEQPNQTSNRKY